MRGPRLGRVRIGALEVRGMLAMVNPHEMGESLLGVSFLNRLRGYEVDSGTDPALVAARA